MNNHYDNLLDPCLYTDAKVSHFVSNLIEPEIDTASDFGLSIIQKTILPTDNINYIKHNLAQRAQINVENTGTLIPEFIVITETETHLTSDIPTNKHQTGEFLLAGKALAFVKSAQCIFFCTMQPISNDLPLFGKNMNSENEWGVITIGNSLRGNCFTFLSQINEIENKFEFATIQDQISRGKFPYPYSDLFYIKDEIEMENIIKQIPKLISMMPELSERTCLINFATTLKALELFKDSH